MGQEGPGDEGGGPQSVPGVDGWVQETEEEEQEVLKTFHSVQAGKSGPTYQEPEYQTESAGVKGTHIGPSDHQGEVVGCEPGHPGVVPKRGAGQKEEHEEGRYQPASPGPLDKSTPECDTSSTGCSLPGRGRGAGCGTELPVAVW